MTVAAQESGELVVVEQTGVVLTVSGWEEGG